VEVRDKEGEYTVALTPTKAAPVQVSVTHFGRHLKGSPFTLSVVVYRREYGGINNQPVLVFGSSGADDGQFSTPKGIASNSRSEIIVADSNRHRIQVFDKGGKFLFKFGSPGTENGQFSNPCGLAVDRRNRIFVVDAGNNRIQVFDEKGIFLNAFGGPGAADGQFNNPYGVGVDKEGNVVVSDGNNYRVQVFDSAGKFSRKFGSLFNPYQMYGGHYRQGLQYAQQGGGLFLYPFGVGILTNGEIFVGDGADGNSRVQLFQPSGQFRQIIATSQITQPGLVFSDSDDNILVADRGNSRIQVFSSNGTFIRTIGSGVLGSCEGVTMDHEGRIIVADTTNNRVVVF